VKVIIPGKYEDVSKSPVLVGAWILERLRGDNSLPGLFLSVRTPAHSSAPYSADDITAGLCFLYACGIITLQGTRVVVNEVN
jgi:hypothetical protein